MKIKVIPLLLLFTCLLPVSLRAHEINTSYTALTVKAGEKQLSLNLILDISDLEKIFDMDQDGSGEVTSDELLLVLAEIQSHYSGKVTVLIRGQEIVLQEKKAEIYKDRLGNIFVKLTYWHDLENLPWALTLEVDIFGDFSPLHKNLVKVVYGEELQQAILTAGINQQRFSFAGEDTSVITRSKQFLWLGMEHIFIGYDHILFLLGLILIGGRFLSLVKIVTSFTIAHSITLILAALEIVLLPGRLVESVIALSIVYIALENFFVKENDQRWLITFIFGLMHGFGFASVLTELGLPTKGLVASMLSFNLGVEVGQIVIVAICYPAILWISRSAKQRQIVYALSSVILALGMLWFVERAFAIEIFFG